MPSHNAHRIAVALVKRPGLATRRDKTHDNDHFLVGVRILILFSNFELPHLEGRTYLPTFDVCVSFFPQACGSPCLIPALQPQALRLPPCPRGRKHINPVVPQSTRLGALVALILFRRIGLCSDTCCQQARQFTARPPPSPKYLKQKDLRGLLWPLGSKTVSICAPTWSAHTYPMQSQWEGVRTRTGRWPS